MIKMHNEFILCWIKNITLTIMFLKFINIKSILNYSQIVVLDCKITICKSCSNEHNYHNIINYNNIIPDMKKIKRRNKRRNKRIKRVKILIKIFKNYINKLKENMEIFYKIYNNIY